MRLATSSSSVSSTSSPATLPPSAQPSQFLWSKSWEFAVQPPRRKNPKCPNGHEYGPNAAIWDTEVCYDANRGYLDAHKEVKSDPAWNTRPHEHYEQVGKAKGYSWPGRQCKAEELGFSTSAQDS